MARYDPDRIAALAAGSLDPAEAATLEAEIAADPRAAAELAAQRHAVEALRRAPSPLLSDAERTELRRAVADALHLDSAPAAAAVPGSRRRVPWRPLAVAAAALATLVAAVPLFGLLSVGDDEAALTTVALSATTLPADAFNTPAAEGGQQDLTAGSPDGDATTLGATAVPSGNLETRALDDAATAVADLVAEPAALFLRADADALPCLEQARILLESPDPIGARLARDGGELVVWFLSADGSTVQRLVAFDPATCEFLAAYP
ncbi:MAG: hypothetical protein JW785_05985 [Acidimicrobiia bacterium]|nr:hypothetical protein [Acidimicrobiia bacterium]